MAEKSQGVLDPLVIAKIANLTMRARFVVEGVLSGLHKSPHQGSSVEFVEHKEYSPGDELKNVDWKVYGRSDKFYVKEFEEETNLRCHIVLDASASMEYGAGGMNKFEYARTLAASLVYLMIRQMDAVGLILFGRDEAAPTYIPARARSTHLQVIIEALERAAPSGGARLSATLEAFAEKVRRRGLLVVISDLFDNADRVVHMLKLFRHRKHEVVLFHVLDPWEMEFPFTDLTRFKSMEDEREVLTEPRAVREAYLRELGAFLERYRFECTTQGIDYHLFSTAAPLDQVLPRYLARRERLVAASAGP